MYIETLYDQIEEEYDHELAERPEYAEAGLRVGVAQKDSLSVELAECSS